MFSKKKIQKSRRIIELMSAKALFEYMLTDEGKTKTFHIKEYSLNDAEATVQCSDMQMFFAEQLDIVNLKIENLEKTV